MSEMKVHNLNVDLIQDQATVSLFKNGTSHPGKSTHTIVTINVPIGSPGDDLESALRHKAIDQAMNALKEAIEALQAHPA